MPPKHHDHHHHHGHGHHHDHHEEGEDPWDDYDWEDLPEDKKKAAAVLGWTQKLWDEDGKPETEEYDWHDLSHEQREAAESFGYHPKLWDEGHGHFHLHDHEHHPPHHDHDHHHHHDNKDEKKDDNGIDSDMNKLNVNDDEKKKTKPTFKTSDSYGGTGGEAFDHGNNSHIKKITIYSDSHVVKGLEIKYTNCTKTQGTTEKSLVNKAHEFELADDEFVTSVIIRSNKFVQSLALKTNKGNMLGPCGGKGWTKINVMGSDPEGEEHKVPAPMKFQLCGFMGRSGKYIDQLAFRWGPVP